MDYLIVVSQIHYWPLYNRDKVTVLQVGDVYHKLVENLDMVSYYDFRIVEKNHSGEQHYCKVLARTLRDGEICFTQVVYWVVVTAYEPPSSLLTSRF